MAVVIRNMLIATVTTVLASGPNGSPEEQQAMLLSAHVGEYAVFHCPLEFPHDFVIDYVLHWNKEGAEVFSQTETSLTASDAAFAGRVSLIPGARGAVNVSSIRESDAGWYECVVNFPNRTPSRKHNGTWFFLEVQGGSLLAIPPINQTTLEGETARFRCETRAEGASVAWLRHGAPIADASELAERSFVDADGTLTINATHMDDPGEFTCVVTGPSGEQVSASAFLDVQYKAKVVQAPGEVYFPYGRSAILECDFRANPALTNLSWKKDGILFDPYNVKGVFYRKNGSLYFSKVDETHAGTYTCTPLNSLGTEGDGPPVQVVVQRPPVFTVTPQNLYLRREGDAIEMPCDAVDGDDGHKPNILWFRKDGLPLPKDRAKMLNGNLTIVNIRESDRGLYQCVASNEAATISSETELRLENVAPRAPYNLSAVSDATSVTLTWVPGFERPRMDYNIWYRPVESSEWRTMRLRSQGAHEATVGNLLPGRTYEFMVLSQDKHGDGMFSKALQVRTKDSPNQNTTAQEFKGTLESFQQIGPPENVSVRWSREGFVVSWQPPEFGGDSVKLYTVQWTKGPRELLHGRADTTDTSFVVPFLEEDTTYQFQVLAISSNNYQASSPTVEISVPGYRRLRAVSVGVSVGALFLVVVAVAACYLRRRRTRSLCKAPSC